MYQCIWPIEKKLFMLHLVWPTEKYSFHSSLFLMIDSRMFLKAGMFTSSAEQSNQAYKEKKPQSENVSRLQYLWLKGSKTERAGNIHNHISDITFNIFVSIINLLFVYIYFSILLPISAIIILYVKHARLQHLVLTLHKNIHSLIHSFIHSLTYSFIHSLTH